MRRTLAVAALLPALATARLARAGGFELPDNGTEALGRGGAFVAKADDGTAIQYNPAGLARQHGTRLLLDGHLVASSYQFQRFGGFPDDPKNPRTPWGGLPYPRVSDSAGPFFAPFLAASTDFGRFDWLTAAVGVFGPSGVGNRTYPLGVEAAPAASRYDVVQTRSLIVLPTAAVGVRVFDGLDLGAALHFVYGSFALTSTSFVDLGDGPQGPCVNAEYQPCDSVSRLDLTGTSWAATLGATAHLSDVTTLALSARTPISIDATGSATVLQSPLGQPIPAPGHATFHTELPWVWRAGVRQAFHDPDGFESGDVELDATYETWGSAQGTGPRIHIDHLGPTGAAFDDIDVLVAHHWNDTFSVRGGGAYNARTDFGVFTVRGGAYYDSSATSGSPGYTRLDFDTLEKIAGTVGVGLRWGAVKVDLAYAEVFEPDRTVGPGAGQIRPIDGAQHGATVNASGRPLPAVNEGVYQGHTEIFSLGVSLAFDALLGWGHPAKPALAAPADHDPPADHEESASPPEAAAAHRPVAAADPKPAARPAARSERPAPKPKKSDWDD